MIFRLLILLLCIMAMPALSGKASAETLRIPFNKLAPAGTVDLKCISAEHTLPIPVPERWDVKKAVIAFDYVNSSTLLAGSRLVVKINGIPVSQINLNAQAPEGSVKLLIPGTFLKPGYNNLTFAVSQHYTNDCEQPCAADLWTTLKLDQAVMEIEYSLKPVPVKLSAVGNFLFDPKILPSGSVNLVLENRNPEIVTLAGLVASGIARRFDYKKVLFTTSADIKPGCDNVIIGNKEFVSDFFKSKELPVPNIIGPLLKVMHLPAPGTGSSAALLDPAHALLIVSGNSTAQLKLAAATLAIVAPSFPNSDELIATEFRLADIPMHGGKLSVTFDKKYTFKNLDFPTVTMKGFHANARDIAFRLPPDVLIKPNLYVDLALHYSYGASLGSGSVINILLNDKHVRAIPLDNPKGDLIEGYKIRIPSRLFRPGDNYLRMETAMIPLNNNSCENILIENLFLTIFEHSTLYFPQLPHFAELPNLELFMLNGFPFTRWPDGKGSLFYLTANDFSTINAALNLAGMMSQKNGYPLFGAQYTYTDPKKFEGELIIVGKLTSIPEDYRQQAPLKLSGENMVPYQFTRNWNDESTVALSKQISGFKPGKAALMEFMSPYTEGRTVMMMTAATPADLEKMSDVLAESSVQASAKGDLAIVDLEDSEFKTHSLLAGKKYLSGRSGEYSIVKRYLYSYPWLYYLAVGLLVIAGSLLLFYLLKNQRKKRIKGASSASGR